MRLSEDAALTIAVLVGLAMAVFEGLLALGLAGAGHGWISPFWLSGAGLVGFPMGLYALLAGRMMKRVTLVLLTGFALLSDLVLVLLTYNEGTHYFHGDDPTHLLWIGLWLSWQLPVFVALARSKSDGPAQ